MSPDGHAWGRIEQISKRAQLLQGLGAIVLAAVVIAATVAYKAGYVVSLDGVKEEIRATPVHPAAAARLDKQEGRIMEMDTELRIMRSTLERVDKRVEKIAEKLGIY
jgi:hypothetical protein